MPTASSSMLGSGTGGGTRLSCDVVGVVVGMVDVPQIEPVLVVVGPSCETSVFDDLVITILCSAGASFGW